MADPTKEYPEGMTERAALRMLLASCEKLRFEMGGTDASKGCSGLITCWDRQKPAVFYMERNMRWAKEVLDRTPDA